MNESKDRAEIDDSQAPVQLEASKVEEESISNQHQPTLQEEVVEEAFCDEMNFSQSKKLLRIKVSFVSTYMGFLRGFVMLQLMPIQTYIIYKKPSFLSLTIPYACFPLFYWIYAFINYHFSNKAILKAKSNRSPEYRMRLKDQGISILEVARGIKYPSKEMVPMDTIFVGTGRILCFDLFNTFLYALHIGLLARRHFFGGNLTLLILLMIFHVLFISAYLLYTYIFKVKSGVSFFNMHGIISVILFYRFVILPKQKSDMYFEEMFETMYISTGLVTLITIFLTLKTLDDPTNDAAKHFKLIDHEPSKEELEAMITQMKAESKGYFRMGIMNLLICGGFLNLLISLNFLIVREKATERKIVLGIFFFVSTVISMAYIWVMVRSKAIFRDMLKSGGSKLLKTKFKLKNKVIHKVSPGFFKKRPDVDKKQKMITKFLKDISVVENLEACNQNDLQQLAISKDDYVLEERRREVIKKNSSSLSVKRSSLKVIGKSTRPSEPASNSIVFSKHQFGNNQFGFSNHLWKSQQQRSKIIDEVKTNLNKRMQKLKEVAEHKFDDQEIQECIICNDRRVLTVNEPCLHGTFCVACSKKVFKQSLKTKKFSRCPVCRHIIQRVQRTEENPENPNTVQVVEELTPKFYQKKIKRALNNYEENDLISDDYREIELSARSDGNNQESAAHLQREGSPSTLPMPVAGLTNSQVFDPSRADQLQAQAINESQGAHQSNPNLPPSIIMDLPVARPVELSSANSPELLGDSLQMMQMAASQGEVQDPSLSRLNPVHPASSRVASMAQSSELQNFPNLRIAEEDFSELNAEGSIENTSFDDEISESDSN